MSLSPLLALAFLPLLIYLYVRANDAKIARLAPEAVAVSPERWTKEDVQRVASSPALTSSSASLFKPEELPPKTGRRYIVVGGVSASSRSTRTASQTLPSCRPAFYPVSAHESGLR